MPRKKPRSKSKQIPVFFAVVVVAVVILAVGYTFTIMPNFVRITSPAHIGSQPIPGSTVPQTSLHEDCIDPNQLFQDGQIIEIDESYGSYVRICPGKYTNIYHSNPYADFFPVFEITTDDITFDCMGAIFVGDYKYLDSYGSTLILAEDATGITVKNCDIRNYMAGIALKHSENSEVVSNKFDYVENAISVGKNSIVKGNYLEDITGSGIILMGVPATVTENEIHGSNGMMQQYGFDCISQEGGGIYDCSLDQEGTITITKNIINGDLPDNPTLTGDSGLTNFYYETFNTNYIITNNEFKGIYAVSAIDLSNAKSALVENNVFNSYATSRFTNSENVIVKNNKFNNINNPSTDLMQTCVSLEGSSNSVVENNEMNNVRGGIRLWATSSSRVSDNIINDAQQYGIFLMSFSISTSDNLVENNKITLKDKWDYVTGVWLRGSAVSQNIIFNNDVYIKSLNNKMDIYGFHIGLGATNNLIQENTIEIDNVPTQMNEHAISILGGESNTFIFNTIKGVKEIVSINDFSDPPDEYFSNNNIFHHNNFLTNDNKITHIAQGKTDKFNSKSKGNYWINYDTPAEGCNDVNADGICDNPYQIPDIPLKDEYPSTEEFTVSTTVPKGFECNLGETQQCPYQMGVCAGSKEFCVGGYWPGCDETTYSDYSEEYEHEKELSCTDGLDNDCDGSIDGDDSDCCLCDSCQTCTDATKDTNCETLLLSDNVYHSGGTSRCVEMFGNGKTQLFDCNEFGIYGQGSGTGIIVYSASGDKIIFDCIVSGFNNGISVEDFRAEVRNSVIENNEIGLFLSYNIAVVENCKIENNYKHGIQVIGSGNDIMNNIITNNGENGINMIGEYNNILNNYVCWNGDGVSTFDIKNTNKQNSGDENSCNTHDDWKDTSATDGCLYTC